MLTIDVTAGLAALRAALLLGTGCGGCAANGCDANRLVMAMAESNVQEHAILLLK